MKNSNKKPAKHNPAASAKRTDLEDARLSVQVKQVQQTCYKAHQKAGTTIQGKIARHHILDRTNFITTYNEKGAKTQEQLFDKNRNKTDTFNDKGLQTESIEYNREGSLFRKTTYTYNKQGGMLETISRNPDGSLYSRSTDTYNDQGKTLEHIHYIGEEKSMLTRYFNTYNDEGNILSNIHYKENDIECETHYKYNEQGRKIEDVTVYVDERMHKYNSRTTCKYNEQGDEIEVISDRNGVIRTYAKNHKYNEAGLCIETTHYEADGGIFNVCTHKYDKKGVCIETTNHRPGEPDEVVVHEYDREGKKIIPRYIPPEPEKAASETEEIENDSRGNWIKKTIYNNKIPVNIYERKIKYFGEEAHVPAPAESEGGFELFGKTEGLFIHPLSCLVNIGNSSELIEDISEPPVELSDQQAQYLAETSTKDNFAMLRYYALMYNQAPSVVTYAGPYIEALALLDELKENMDAQQIHSYSTVWDGHAEQLKRYTLSFLHRPYLLQASSISRHDEDGFVVPRFIKESSYHYDGSVYTSQLEFLRPSNVSGKRDVYFEEELREYIKKCSLRKKPDKPTIHMIEVRQKSFKMVEHAVDDDFEIKDLNVNYGWGFEKFHDQLMKRFNTSTKGLVLFHGVPGTGKTYYIRHLLRKMVSCNRKAVIYMPPNMVDHLVEPQFMTFLSDEIKNWADDGFFCVLLIEDAEPLLAKRQEGVRIQGVTNLLNLSDGILNDMLNLQLICTFNVDLKRLDSALLRPGRLIARKEFKPLSELDANLLAGRLGIKHHFTRPATLGEIYALLKDKYTLVHDVEPDKDASTAVDEL